MKTEKIGTEKNRSFINILSLISNDEILNTNEMICVRGGEGEAVVPIIIPPTRP